MDFQKPIPIVECATERQNLYATGLLHKLAASYVQTYYVQQKNIEE